MKYRFFFAALILSSAIFLAGSAPATSNEPDEQSDSTFVNIFSKSDDPWVEKILAGMTLEEKAGQVVFSRAAGMYMSTDSPEFQRMVHAVKDLKVGGIILTSGNIYDQAIITNKLQEISKIPLLVSADFERGVAQRSVKATLFPYNMGIGAADDIELTYEMGKIIALEGKALGVHQNYAPVSDVNNNAFNPIINVRSFGESVTLVERLSNAFLKGIQDAGMIATSKHFPGHGNTNVDSHRKLPVIPGTKDELYKIELYPFEANIKAGVMSFMIAHLDVPAFDQTKVPSTLSKNIITDLLQNEMGFKGLVVTDAMSMRAISSTYSAAEAAVRTLQAGTDMVLLPANDDEAINAIIAAVKNGILTEERLDHSIRKILLAKKWAGLDKNKLTDINKIADVVGIEEHWEVAKKLARKSITLVKDEENLIPLSTANNLKYGHISILDSRFGGEENYFNKLLISRVSSLDSKTISLTSTEEDYEAALKSAEDANVIILSAYLKVRAYEGDLGLTGDQAELVRKILAMDKPVMFASHGNPYILSSFKEAKAYICNYGDTDVSEEALAEALFGEISIQGKLPVSIPETGFNFGSGVAVIQSSIRNESNIYSKSEKIKFAEVDKVIEDAIKDTAFPGAVLLIAKDGKILHERAFGKYTYVYASSPLTPNTIFDMASVSKVVATTTAVMICVDKNLISLDDKVAKHIPEFAVNGKENITIRNLMLHNSGLPAWKKFYEVYETPEEILKDIYNSKLEFEPGTKMVYSDLGMITMGKLIERVSGKTLDEFCKDEIFVPLGMMSTMYNPPVDLRNKIAPTELDEYWRHRQLIGEVHDEASSLLGGVAGHAGLFSTANDLAKFLQMLLQKGSYKGKQFINPATVKLFIAKQSDLSSRGLGWDTKDPERSSAGNLFSDISYGHTGYTGTSVWTDPTKDLFVVLLTNRVYPTRNNNKLTRIRPRVHDAVMKAVE